MKHIFIFLLLGLFLWTGCESEPKIPPLINGVISFRDDFKLPADVVVSVRLLDLSNGEEKEMNKIQFQPNGQQIPLTFKISYLEKDIQKNGKYVLDAEINFSVANLYYTLEPYEVLNNGVKNDVVMILVKGPKPKE